MRKTLLSVLFISVAFQSVEAQKWDWEVHANSFFDNSEGNQAYRLSDTYGGFRLQPQLSLSTNDRKHQLTAGYDAFFEFGNQQKLDANGFLAYYQLHSDRLQISIGKFSRRIQKEELPDYLLCDSVKYYRPYVMGFDVQYTGDNGYLDVFLDWTFKRSETVREQFMAGAMARYNVGPMLLGINGYYYHYANVRLGNPDSTLYGLHDNLLVHPYVGTSQKGICGLDSIDVRLGLLASIDRDRALDKKFHVPVGFLGELDMYWRRFGLNELVYLGKRHQYYGETGFLKYYWGDAYYRSPFYWRTGVTYTIVSDRFVALKAGLVFHVTDKGLHCNQMLTLSASLYGDELKRSSRRNQ